MLPIKDRFVSLADDLKSKFPDLKLRQAAYTKWFREHRSEVWPFQDYKFIDDIGIYTGSRSVHNPGKEGYRYDVIHPKTKLPCKQPMMGYRFPESTMSELLSAERIIFGDDETKIIELKLYAQDYKAKLASVVEMDTRLGANELKEIFSEGQPFRFPKKPSF